MKAEFSERCTKECWNNPYWVNFCERRQAAEEHLAKIETVEVDEFTLLCNGPRLSFSGRNLLCDPTIHETAVSLSDVSRPIPLQQLVHLEQ